jgi:CRISPR system Cascade subunit CasA
MPAVRLAVVTPAITAVALLLAGCAAYVPAPVHPEAYPAALQARTLDKKPASETWTGGDLLAAALARNVTVAEAAAKYRTAVAGAKASRVAPSMTLTLTAEYARSESKRWLYGVGSDIPLDIGTRRGERLNAADLAAVQALYDYGEVVWTVRTSLTRARADRLSADAEMALASRLETVRQVRVERLDRRVAAGEDDRGMALTARTDLAVAHRRVADARTRRAQADAALAQALGVPVSAVTGLALTPVSPTPPDLDFAQARRDAALTRRDVLRAMVDYDLAEGALRLEIAKQYPEIHVGPGYTYDHGVTKLPFNLGLVLPPLDLNRAAIAQAEAKRAEAGHSLEAVQAAALGAADRAWSALGAARVTEASTRERDLPVARRLAEATARGAKAGEVDRVEELGAQATLIEAELAVLDAHRAAIIADIDLEDALRTPFDPAETNLLQTASRALGARQ